MIYTPMCLGTSPKGNEINWGVCVDSTTRQSKVFFKSFLSITNESYKANARFFLNKINASRGPL